MYDLFNPIPDVPTKARINKESLSKQNKAYLELLMTGNKINMFDCLKVGVGTPHSRISDVRSWLNSHNIVLYSEMVSIKNYLGDPISVKNYWISPEDIEKIKLDN